MELNDMQNGQKDLQKVPCSYKSVCESIKILESTVASYENDCTRAESFINDYFANVVHEIDIQRELAVKEIMEKSEKLIQEVQEQKERCIKNLNKNRKMEEKLYDVKMLKEKCASYSDMLNSSHNDADLKYIQKKSPQFKR